MALNDNQDGKNLEGLQNMNRALVIKLLYRKECSTRIELSCVTGLKRATISNIIDDLICWGLVHEIGHVSGKKGRRSIALELNTSRYLSICVRIYRDAVMMGIFDLNNTCLDGIQAFHTSGIPPSQVINEIIESIKKLAGHIETGRLGKLIGIGFAVPGPFIRQSGEFTVLTHSPEWDNIDLRNQISRHFTIPVFFEQDANCAALAEWWYHDNSSKHSSLLFLLAGPGIGAGIIEDGHILSGALGIAGEVGHMSINFAGPQCECGNKGCFELYANTFALINEVERLIDKDIPTTLTRNDLSIETILAAIKTNDPLAVKAFDRIAWILGFGIVNLVNIYNPGIIFIGDVLSLVGEPLIKAIDEVLHEYLPNKIYSALKVELHHYTKEDIILHGANAMVFDNILNDPRLIHSFCQDE